MAVPGVCMHCFDFLSIFSLKCQNNYIRTYQHPNWFTPRAMACTKRGPYRQAWSTPYVMQRIPRCIQPSRQKSTKPKKKNLLVLEEAVNFKRKVRPCPRTRHLTGVHNVRNELNVLFFPGFMDQNALQLHLRCRSNPENRDTHFTYYIVGLCL